MDPGKTGGTDQVENDAKPSRKRLDLSVPQVAGSAVAAITAAVLASQLGVYGTVIGAGVVSVVATCGASVFQHVFRRTGEQIRVVTVQAKPKGRQVPAAPTPPRPSPAAAGEVPPRDGEFGEATVHGTRVRGWKRPVRAAVVVFLVAMIGITGFELISGRDLSGGKGTTVGTVVGGGHDRRAPSHTPGDTPDPGQDPGGTSGTGGGGPSDGGTAPAAPPPGTTSGGGAGQGGTSGQGGTPPASPTPTPSHSATTPPATPTPTPTPTGGGNGGKAGNGTSGADGGTNPGGTGGRTPGTGAKTPAG
ncbi:hypothetical protein [Streptomyces liangshanensis]|uniref:Uncharacterized protein n=1 Tax=Streptomyces liangshanensis TaxID=2717324 RepID=A0A6G9GVE7_9ACTN|nr:hypothetical protein [Streptomyces liangshanensis]QIQ02242.1 hypothetical protein HA039_07935 [Streptomyces liangshanensis]